jgi:hypothetical protein
VGAVVGALTGIGDALEALKVEESAAKASPEVQVEVVSIFLTMKRL